MFGEQATRAKNAINQIAGKINPALGNILPTSIFATDTTPAVEAVKPFPHLLIMQPHKHEAPPYYFNLDTAAFDELSRQSSFRWASQERLTRRSAQQSVGMGEEKMPLKGRFFRATGAA
ncbi:phage protein U [Pseudomonas taetrolens]|nr:phage protein U [Pseudomonas taetrolens]VEH50117.1 phage protein U [Pseudomonas taetrolens]